MIMFFSEKSGHNCTDRQQYRNQGNGLSSLTCINGFTTGLCIGSRGVCRIGVFGVVGSVFVADVEGIVGVSFAVTVFVYLHF